MFETLSPDHVLTGSKVYVWAGDEISGGLATVSAADATKVKGEIMVEMAELPNIWFKWRVLAEMQEELGKQYAGQCARVDDPARRPKADRLAEANATIAALESQVAGLTEALRGVLPWLEEFHPMCADEPCVVFLAWKQAKDALSLTPSDLAALESKLSRALTRIKEMHTTECAIWRQCQADDGRTPGISAIEKALDYEVHRTVKFLNEIEPIGTTVPKEV